MKDFGTTFGENNHYHVAGKERQKWRKRGPSPAQKKTAPPKAHKRQKKKKREDKTFKRGVGTAIKTFDELRKRTSRAERWDEK